MQLNKTCANGQMELQTAVHSKYLRRYTQGAGAGNVKERPKSTDLQNMLTLKSHSPFAPELQMNTAVK
jgi:hypothetical protein